MSTYDGASGSYESRDEADKAARKGGDTAFVRMWLDALETASIEEKDWRKEAEEAARAYRGERVSGQREFNIFHANVETIVPALYNSTPIPDVRRRYSDPDPAGKEVADNKERSRHGE